MILKKNDITPERPVILVLYGTPGSGKTSVATTAEKPILIDCDRGWDRAVQRIDTLVANKWEEIIEEQNQNTFANYKTIIVDTAKSAIDDYLADYVVRQDFKLQRNALKRFGQMGEEFKLFVNNLRARGSDIIFICHDKEIQDGDIIKHQPDCTGQSKDLLVRIADEVGYVSVINKKRTISFEPTDNFVGKNVAQLDRIVIPDFGTSEYGDFMKEIIKDVKKSIMGKSEEQRKANEMLEELRDELNDVTNEESIKKIMSKTKNLPKILQMPFFNEMCKSLEDKGYVFDKDKKIFVSAA